MADIGKVLNLAARVYLARKDAGTGGIKNTYAPTKTGGLGSIAKNIGINMGTNALMSKLGLAALGPLGMLLSPFVSRFIGNKFSGLGLNPGGGGGKTKGPNVPKGPVTSPDTPSDDGFQVTGTYGGNDFYSAEGTTVDEETGDLTNADGTYGGNINDEFGVSGKTTVSTPTTTYTGPAYDEGGDSGGGQSDSQAGADASQSASDEDAGAGGYAYGGRASYSGGGLASLYR